MPRCTARRLHIANHYIKARLMDGCKLITSAAYIMHFLCSTPELRLK